MPDQTDARREKIWIAAYTAAFSRFMGEHWPAEKAVDAARDEADIAVHGASKFIEG